VPDDVVNRSERLHHSARLHGTPPVSMATFRLADEIASVGFDLSPARN
jgi:hypothetical protein